MCLMRKVLNCSFLKMMFQFLMAKLKGKKKSKTNQQQEVYPKSLLNPKLSKECL